MYQNNNLHYCNKNILHQKLSHFPSILHIHQIFINYFHCFQFLFSFYLFRSSYFISILPHKYLHSQNTFYLILLFILLYSIFLHKYLLLNKLLLLIINFLILDSLNLTLIKIHSLHSSKKPNYPILLYLSSNLIFYSLKSIKTILYPSSYNVITSRTKSALNEYFLSALKIHKSEIQKSFSYLSIS
jgi:hypothetical protein